MSRPGVSDMAETDSYLRRIGGGWPEPEVETCDWCDAETPTAQDQYMRNIGTTTYWLCARCYRKSLAAQNGQATLEGWA
jgi:hypothetical protein